MFDFPLPRITAEIRSVFLKGDKGDPGDTGPAGPQGEPGKAPRVGENDNWEIYDNETQEWTDTGVCAKSVRSYNELTDVPETFPPDAHRHEIDDVNGLSEVAKTGDYADLTGTENIAEKDYVAEQISSIEVGGTNILHGTDDMSIAGEGSWRTSTWVGVAGNSACVKAAKIDINDAPNANIHSGIRVTMPSGIDTWNGVTQQKVPLVIGYTYTLSCYARVTAGSGECQSQLAVDLDGSPTYQSSITSIGTAWTRCAFTYTVPENCTNVNVDAGFHLINTSGETTMEICGMKLEIGNKPTDWSPAPEDVDKKIVGRNYIVEPYTSRTIKGLISSQNTAPILVASKEVALSLCNTTITISCDYDCNIVSGSCNFKMFSDFHTLKAFDTDTNGTGRIVETLIPKIYPGNESYFDDGSFLYLQGTFDGTVTLYNLKVEIGNRATDWSLAPEDTNPRRAGITYDYGGRNLKEIFGTAEALHNALAAENYSQIAVGDYWPITLNGAFWDYGSFTLPTGIDVYSNDECTGEPVGVSGANNEGQMISENVVYYNTIYGPRYAKIADCLPYFERTCNDVTVKLEVAGINHYWRYGDSGELTGNKPHIVLISRDCVPFNMRMRKGNTHWESTDINNPWLGSAMYKTLNGEAHGVLPLVAATDIGAYIYAGPNKLGMRALLETKAPDAANATGWTWYDRGKLFLPSVAEVWGHPFWAEMNWEGGLGNQFAIFRQSRRHIAKGNGDAGSKTAWWMGSSNAGSTTHFSYVHANCDSDYNLSSNMYCVPICFIFA